MPFDQTSETKASRSTIGLSVAGGEALQAILDKKWFATSAAAFKAAVAYAIANDLVPTASGSYKTSWNVGTLDKGDFSAVIGMMLGVDDPWPSVEGLADAGLRAMASRASEADVPTEALLPE